jgi:F-type H+-transporting ATPase subunit b
VLIDWFTIIAQIVNFLVLVALLRYFLYEPIIQTMDAREARIAADLEAAERKRAEAVQEIETYRDKNRELEARRDEWLREARQEVEAHQKDLTQKARHEVDEARERWYGALQQEKDAFLQELRRRAGHQLYAIARQALADLAGEELEERLVARFVEQLDALEGEERQAFVEALRQGEQEVVIYSAHELPEPMRRRLTTAVHALHDDRTETLRFATRPELIGGLELRTDGYKMAWSLADYLAALEEELSEIIHA